VLRARGLSRTYDLSGGWFHAPARLRALDDVSFTILSAKTLAVVGESGSGKSTLGRIVALVEPASSGHLLIGGTDPREARGTERRHLRQAVQMVFQDPYGSLNPRKSVAAIVGEPLAINSRLSAHDRRRRVNEMLAHVGLQPDHGDRYPHMLSGGQRQRVAVARALILRPRLVVADEPTSALDLSIQAQVLNLLRDLQDQFGVAYLFISHNLALVRHIADRVLVLYLGRIVEYGPTEAIFQTPRHPDTQALLAAVPRIDPTRRSTRLLLPSEPPSPIAPPPGCAFHFRCPHATDLCVVERPNLRLRDGRLVACHHVERTAFQVVPGGTVIAGAGSQQAPNGP
jgi:dipeptide transport system ATP-binding protein